MSALRVVISDLEYLEADWDSSELLIYNPKVLLRHYFVITLVTKEHVLESVLRSLTTFLQAKLCDFVESKGSNNSNNSGRQIQRYVFHI